MEQEPTQADIKRMADEALKKSNELRTALAETSGLCGKSHPTWADYAKARTAEDRYSEYFMGIDGENLQDQDHEPKGARQAYFYITKQLLVQALGMPSDTILLRICQGDDPSIDMFALVVSHPDLKEVPEGAAIPKITPQITSIRWEWGQQHGSL